MNEKTKLIQNYIKLSLKHLEKIVDEKDSKELEKLESQARNKAFRFANELGKAFEIKEYVEHIDIINLINDDTNIIPYNFTSFP